MSVCPTPLRHVFQRHFSYYTINASRAFLSSLELVQVIPCNTCSRELYPQRYFESMSGPGCVPCSTQDQLSHRSRRSPVPAIGRRCIHDIAPFSSLVTNVVGSDEFTPYVYPAETPRPVSPAGHILQARLKVQIGSGRRKLLGARAFSSQHRLKISGSLLALVTWNEDRQRVAARWDARLHVFSPTTSGVQLNVPSHPTKGGLSRFPYEKCRYVTMQGSKREKVLWPARG